MEFITPITMHSEYDNNGRSSVRLSISFTPGAEDTARAYLGAVAKEFRAKLEADFERQLGSLDWSQAGTLKKSPHPD